ncbi:hypothetical protein H5410_055940, partial [Solanum commersonii]
PKRIFEVQIDDVLDEADVEVRFATRIIPKRESFKYLGSVIQGSGDIDDDATASHWGCLDEMEACLLSLLNRLCCMERSVGDPKRMSKNACCGDEDVEMDVWAH